MASTSWVLLVLSMLGASAGNFDPESSRLDSAEASLGTPDVPVHRVSYQADKGSVRPIARWVGQEQKDCVGPGVGVGPDGLQDARIHLAKLPANEKIKAIRIEGKTGMRWEFGLNPQLLANAEFVIDPKDPTQGDIFFQPDRDVNAQRLKVAVLYENQKIDSVTVAAGRFDPKLAMPRAPLPRVVDGKATTRWLGQDGKNPARPGDVHVELKGLPRTGRVVGAVLNDSVRGVWIYRADGKVAIPVAYESEPLYWEPRGDRTSADLFFNPYRDTSSDKYTLRLVMADGQNVVMRFAGGKSDLARLAPPPAADRADARPGDDLQTLVDRCGTVNLASGTYRLTRPLILNHPITLTSDGTATLRFAQGASEPPWTTAIKIRESNTTLSGFAVRFDGPVRWNNDVSYGPAVIGMTDNLEPAYNAPKWNIVLSKLDLEVPPIEKKSADWVDALRLMRLVGARNGVIADNTLRGGLIEFFNGPWRIENNSIRGTLAGTFSHGVFVGHNPTDTVVLGNRTAILEPSGKTWRFLVFTGGGYNNIVEKNVIAHIGSRDDDTIPWINAPEIILTEAYHVKYEGKVMGLSTDGRVVRIGRPQGDAISTGLLVSLLTGPAAGQWRRVDQVIDSSTFLVDPPIPAGTDFVSISAGFVDNVYRENRIDLRAGHKSCGFVLAGNQFGTRVIKNHVSGGDYSIWLTAYPSETPMIWGWTHAPALGLVVDGNTFEDGVRGTDLGVVRNNNVKTSQGRTYMTIKITNNVIGWSRPFLEYIDRAGNKNPAIGISLGTPDAREPGELVVVAEGNRLEAPSSRPRIPSLVIHAADYNSKKIVNKKFELISDADARPASRREASTRSSPAPR